MHGRADGHVLVGMDVNNGFAAAIAHSVGPSGYGTLGDDVGSTVGTDGMAVGTYVGGVTVGSGVGHGDTGQWLPIVVAPSTSPQLFDTCKYDLCTANNAVIELGTDPVR